jgi:hypothetical protein
MSITAFVGSYILELRNLFSKGHDGLSYMIACDKCGEWFHGDCIGLAKHLYNKNIDFVCFACSTRYNMEMQYE